MASPGDGAVIFVTVPPVGRDDRQPAEETVPDFAEANTILVRIEVERRHSSPKIVVSRTCELPLAEPIT